MGGAPPLADAGSRSVAQCLAASTVITDCNRDYFEDLLLGPCMMGWWGGVPESLGT